MRVVHAPQRMSHDERTETLRRYRSYLFAMLADEGPAPEACLTRNGDCPVAAG